MTATSAPFTPSGMLVRIGRPLASSQPVLRFGEAGIRTASRATRRRSVAHYLRTAQTRRLTIGAGTHVRPHWLSTDLSPMRRSTVYLDARKPFPLPSESFDRIHSEHMIEHIAYVDAECMLKECRRIMRGGGVIRLATPDLAHFARLMVREPTSDEATWIRWSNRRDQTVPAAEEASAAHAVNRMARAWGHTFLYDEGTLARLLARCGFDRVVRTEVNQSEFSDLRGLERHGDTIGEQQNRFETMVLEARVPDY